MASKNSFYPGIVETPDNPFVIGGPNVNRPPLIDGGRSIVDGDITPVRPGGNTGSRDGRDSDGVSTPVVPDGRGGRTDVDPTDNPYGEENGTGPQTDSSSIDNPQNTIDSLNQYLKDLGGQLSSWKEFYDLMNTIFRATGADDFVNGAEARLAITEKIADMVYNFTATLYSNTFQSQMWYEQQAYNSPLQQLHRLADAGLLGMWNNIGTGIAESAANSSPLSNAPTSDAAQIQAQQKQARMERIMNGIGFGLELASLGVTGFQAATDLGVKQSQALLQITQASSLSQLTPHQVRNSALDCYVKQGQLSLMSAEQQLKEANIPLVSAQTYSTYKHCDFLKENLAQGWANMAQTLQMFKDGQALTKELGYLQANTSLASANIAANASMYAADTAANASMFGSLSQFSIDEEGFMEVDKNGQVHGDWKFGTDLGLMDLDTKVGGVYSSGNRRYLKMRRSVPAAEFVRRQSEWCSSRSPSNLDFKDEHKHLSDYVNFSKSYADKIGMWYKLAIVKALTAGR